MTLVFISTNSSRAMTGLWVFIPKFFNKIGSMALIKSGPTMCGHKWMDRKLVSSLSYFVLPRYRMKFRTAIVCIKAWDSIAFHYDTVPRLWIVLDWGNIVYFSKFFIVFYELGPIPNPFRSCWKVFKRYWGSVSVFRSYPRICSGGHETFDRSVSSSFYFMILGSFFIYSDGVWRFSRDTGVPCPRSEVIQQSVLGESWYWMGE